MILMLLIVLFAISSYFFIKEIAENKKENDILHKNNLITTKEKINEFTINENNNTAEDYASQKVQNDISYVSRKGAIKSNEIGKKSLKEIQENFIKGKQKVEILFIIMQI